MNTYYKNSANRGVKEVIITGEEMREKVKELGRMISEKYEGKNPLLICVLKGAVVFFADLLREITIPVQIEFISVSSYGSSNVSSGVVTLKKDISGSVAGKHVIIVEDIIDTGFTLKYIKDLFLARGSESVAICCALDKPSRRDKEVDIKVDYCGFQIPDEFVVGYGLDYAQQYRNLPDVCVLEPEVYEKK